MIKFKLAIIIFYFSLLACGQKSNRHTANPVAVRLNNRAMEAFPYIKNKDSADKIIILLDSATALDSNYFIGYYNKQMVLSQLKLYDRSTVALQNLIRLRPNANDLFLNGGILYEAIGDTGTSRIYFRKSLIICKSILDTMNVNNRDYATLGINMALNLIMLGQEKEGNGLLAKVYEGETDSSVKELTKSYIKKSKRELIDMLTNPKNKDVQSVSVNIDH